jgi:hypothetical protein
MREVYYKRLWPVAMSIMDASTCLQVPRQKLYDALNAGKLVYFQEGKHRRVLVISLFEYIEKHWKRVDSRGQPIP